MAKNIEIEIKKNYKFPDYSKEELQELNRLFDEKYNGLNTGEDIKKWLIDEGALDKYESVVITGYHYKKNRVGELYPACDYPTKYVLLQDKMEKANKLLNRKEYAIRRNLEEIEKSIGNDEIILPHDPELTINAYLN